MNKETKISKSIDKMYAKYLSQPSDTIRMTTNNNRFLGRVGVKNVTIYQTIYNNIK